MHSLEANNIYLFIYVCIMSELQEEISISLKNNYKYDPCSFGFCRLVGNMTDFIYVP